MAIEKLSVILELISGQYKREAKEAAAATSSISGAARSAHKSFKDFMGPAAIGGVILGLGRMAVAAGENADRLFDLQVQTGLSTDALQEWEFVTQTAGANTEAFADAVKAVIRNLDPTEGAVGNAAKAYDALGISVFDASGKLKDAGTITEEAFTKLSDMEDITARNALAQDLFGKKWEETVTILDLGSEAIGAARQEARDLGLVVSGESLRGADKFRQSFEKLKAVLQGRLMEMLGDLGPVLSDVAESIVDIVDESEPLLDFLGGLVNIYTDLKGAIDDGQESENGFIRFLSDGADMVFSFGGGLGQFVKGFEMFSDALSDGQPKLVGFKGVVDEVHDSWLTFNGVAFSSIDMINNQATAFSNAATAADNQRTALINLANFQASQLSPIGNIIRLQQELETAQTTLTEAQKDSKTPADELALAQLGVAEAMLAVQGAGLALEPDQIQAFAQLLITQFGYSEQAALDTLDALNLLDGWSGTATFTLEMDKVVSGPGAVGNINTDLLGFASGGIVPGWRGQPQLVLAHGGEMITPAGQTTNSNSRTTINNFAGPVKPVDLQWLALMSNLETLVS